MDELKFPLSTVTEEGVTVDAVAAAGNLRPQGADELPLDAVSVSGALTRIGEEYLFRGTLSGIFEHACDRCLEGAASPFVIPVLWSFTREHEAAPGRESDHADDDWRQVDDAMQRRLIDGMEIDLASAVWEELALATPTKYLCKDDCAGLCPICGANLNRKRCRCNEMNTKNTGLSALADMFPDLRPENPKE